MASWLWRRIPRLLAAYRQGIFPWFSPGDPILWWSPDPRAILYPTELHISRSMRRFLRQCPYRFTLNCAFSDVVTACATARKEETWISGEIQQAYCQLHQLGYAHSVEVWQEDIPSSFDAAALLAMSPRLQVDLGLSGVARPGRLAAISKTVGINWLAVYMVSRRARYFVVSQCLAWQIMRLKVH